MWQCVFRGSGWLACFAPITTPHPTPSGRTVAGSVVQASPTHARVRHEPVETYPAASAAPPQVAMVGVGGYSKLRWCWRAKVGGGRRTPAQLEAELYNQTVHR
jgi:hypothetical protein